MKRGNIALKKRKERNERTGKKTALFLFLFNARWEIVERWSFPSLFFHFFILSISFTLLSALDLHEDWNITGSWKTWEYSWTSWRLYPMHIFFISFWGSVLVLWLHYLLQAQRNQEHRTPKEREEKRYERSKDQR